MLEIKIDKFQGPLSLLLQIIEKEELDITTLSLAQIADDYLEYIKNSENISPQSMVDFLLLAARLLYIKSRALLPYLMSPEEEEEVKDLEDKLKMYRDFVSLSNLVQKMIGRKKFSYTRVFNRKNIQVSSFLPPRNLKIDLMSNTFEGIINRIEESLEEKLEEKLIISELSIEEKISFIKDRVIRQIKLNFTKILQEANSRTEIIVNFLAVLELSKQKEISFKQDDLFGEIYLEAYSGESGE